MKFLSATLAVITSGCFVFSIAWTQVKDNMKMILADDFPAHGPWIVSVGKNEYLLIFLMLFMNNNIVKIKLTN